MSTVIDLPQSNNANNTNNTPAQNTSQEFQSNAILQRMKEMEQQIMEFKACIQNLELENNKKNEIIKKLENDKMELSAEKRKDMEQILETAVNDWLNSLKGISEDVRQQFKNGITDLAQKADIKNHAWEVICNASQAHRENVARIEELVKICNEKEKTIESLLQNNNDPSFKSVNSRIGHEDSTQLGQKRMRLNDENTDSKSSVIDRKDGKDAWDTFSSILLNQSRDQYF
jgi:hypothetical protein